MLVVSGVSGVLLFTVMCFCPRLGAGLERAQSILLFFCPRLGVGLERAPSILLLFCPRLGAGLERAPTVLLFTVVCFCPRLGSSSGLKTAPSVPVGAGKPPGLVLTLSRQLQDK